jgi:hypothetical protein
VQSVESRRESFVAAGMKRHAFFNVLALSLRYLNPPRPDATRCLSVCVVETKNVWRPSEKKGCEAISNCDSWSRSPLVSPRGTRELAWFDEVDVWCHGSQCQGRDGVVDGDGFFACATMNSHY